MMKKIICLCLASLLTLSLIGCNANGDNSSSIGNSSSQETESSGGQEQKPEVVKDINAVYPAQGGYVHLTSDTMTEWLNAHSNGSSYDYTEGTTISTYYKGIDFVTLSWSDELDCDLYVLRVDTNKDWSSADMYQVTSKEKALKVINEENPSSSLYVNTRYYWQVIGYKGGKQATVSDVFHFTTASTPRNVVVDGVRNVRDVGGYMTSFGKKVKQGMLYRCAAPEGVTELGKKQATQVYGIKTEIDLRGAFPFQTSGTEWKEELLCQSYAATGRSIFSYEENKVAYKYFWTPFYVAGLVGLNSSYETPDKGHINDEQFVKIVKEFANPDAYPIIYHCAAGRDRTGTLSCVLNALLGVADDDLYIDYETTFFEMNDGSYVPSFINMIQGVIKYLYTFEGETLADKTANYLMTYGMTQQEIDTIREIMLED